MEGGKIRGRKFQFSSLTTDHVGRVEWFKGNRDGKSGNTGRSNCRELMGGVVESKHSNIIDGSKKGTMEAGASSLCTNQRRGTTRTWINFGNKNMSIELILLKMETEKRLLAVVMLMARSISVKKG